MLQHILSLAPHYALPFIIVISVVVFVHEFGHYWVARRCGVKIEAFSIGFGKEIFGWTDKHGTRWKVSWLPLGGYVKMFGDADASSRPDDAVKAMTDDEKKVAFFHQSVNKRIAIVFAGPATNYLFAILALAFLFMVEGQPYSSPRISDIVENGVAAQAGLRVGDIVQTVDGTKVDRFEDIRRIVSLNEGTPLPIDVDRDGQMLSFTLTPEVTTIKDHFGGEHKLGRIGIVAKEIEHKKWPPLMALKQAVVETGTMTADTLKSMGQMIIGARGSEELGGPLRIAEMSGQVAEDGPMSVLWFMGIISINLGLINLFPIPLLDGGHLLFYAIERIRRKPLSEKIQDVGMRAGLTVVLSLMVFSTWNDLVHLKVIAYVRSLFS